MLYEVMTEETNWFSCKNYGGYSVKVMFSGLRVILTQKFKSLINARNPLVACVCTVDDLICIGSKQKPEVTSYKGFLMTCRYFKENMLDTRKGVVQ